MSRHDATEPLDLDAYRQDTADLLASMDETATLFDDLSDNMSQLGDSFERFGETKDRLRASRTALAAGQSHASAAGD